jgi:hypothetical protein
MDKNLQKCQLVIKVQSIPNKGKRQSILRNSNLSEMNRSTGHNRPRVKKHFPLAFDSTFIWHLIVSIVPGPKYASEKKEKKKKEEKERSKHYRPHNSMISWL